MKYAVFYTTLIVLIAFACIYLSRRDKFKQEQAEAGWNILLMEAQYKNRRDFREGLAKGPNNTTGTDNVAIGHAQGFYNVTIGTNTVFIGKESSQPYFAHPVHE